MSRPEVAEIPAKNAAVRTLNDARFLNALVEEVAAAREKFPTNETTLAALTKVSGELSKALIDHRAGKATVQDIWKHATQVSATAMRLAVEGDASFPYQGRDSE